MMQKAKQLILIVVGSLALGLGILGIILPLLPTTPFLLLAAACFVRSSDRLYKWLITNKWFGRYIENFRSGKGIPLKVKITGISVLWVSILFSAFFVINLIWIRILLLLIASYFSWVIISFKTLQE